MHTIPTQSSRLSRPKLPHPVLSVTKAVSEDDDLYEDLYKDEYKDHHISVQSQNTIVPNALNPNHNLSAHSPSPRAHAHPLSLSPFPQSQSYPPLPINPHIHVPVPSPIAPSSPAPIAISTVTQSSRLCSVIQEVQAQIQMLSLKYLQLEAMVNGNKYLKQHQPNQGYQAPEAVSSRIFRGMETQTQTQTEGGGVGNLSAPGYGKNKLILNDDHNHKNTGMMEKTPMLMNNWRNYGQKYSRFKVYKIGAIVYLQGCLTGGNMGQTICQLPTGCCPSGTITQCCDQEEGINGRIRIKTDGQIIPEYMNKSFVYLDGISFISASDVIKIDDEDQKMLQTNDNTQGNDYTMDVTPELQDGWKNIGGGYAPFKVYKIANVVYLQGCVKGGKIGSIRVHFII